MDISSWVAEYPKAAARERLRRVSFPHLDQHQPSDRFLHAHPAAGGHEPSYGYLKSSP
jgi:hypothetical protein